MLYSCKYKHYKKILDLYKFVDHSFLDFIYLYLDPLHVHLDIMFLYLDVIFIFSLYINTYRPYKYLFQTFLPYRRG